MAVNVVLVMTTPGELFRSTANKIFELQLPLSKTLYNTARETYWNIYDNVIIQEPPTLLPSKGSTGL